MDYENHILIRGLKEGNEEAYKELYRVYYKFLCIWGYRLVKDEFTAETLVSDIFFSIWENRDHLHIEQDLRSYLIRAVRNRCLNYLDHLYRHEELKTAMQSISREREKGYELDTSYPLAGLMEKELYSKVRTSLDKLPVMTREIFELSRFHDMTYEEIAHELSVSVNVVKYHIKSALSKLREDLKDYLILMLTGIIFL